MNTVKVGNLILGEGRPKICIPIAENSREEILRAAGEILSLPGDLAEWRGDWYGEVFAPGKAAAMLESLRRTLGGMPLLFTFRTKAEGGVKEAPADAYEKLLGQVIAKRAADLVDLELFTLGERGRKLTELAHENGLKVVMSSHDFEKTPPEEELLRRLDQMVRYGADLPKIAVMPKSPQDVLTLLSAAGRFSRESGGRPLIAMSMGPLGMMSRVCGGAFGSCLTFGSASRASAPGQLPAGKLLELLELFGGGTAC